MESLFRFLLVRPVEALEPVPDAIVVKPSPDAQLDFQQALASERPAAELRLAAAAVTSRIPPWSNPEVTRIDAAAKVMADVEDGTIKAAAKARTALAAAFGGKIADLASDQSLKTLEEACVDRVAAAKYGGRRAAGESGPEALIRTVAYIRLLAATKDDNALPAPLDFARKVLIIDGLGAIQRTPRSSDPPPDGARAREALLAEQQRLERQQVEIEGVQRELARLPADRLLAPPAGEPEPRGEREENAHVEASGPGRLGMAMSTPMPRDTRPALSREVLERLSPAQQTMFDQLVPAGDRHDLVNTLLRLDDGAREAGLRSAEIAVRLAPETTALVIGGGVFSTMSTHVNTEPSRGEGAPGVPLTHGSVQSVGIGDLLVVKQNLKGYEARELSHVDNVLKSEHKSTTTRRARTTEETVVDEREMTTEEERDLQSTERFEMQRESTKVQKEDESLKIGASLSGSYGPMIEFKVTTDLGMSSSKEESHKSAETYGKDVTNRAVSKVTERVRTQVTTRTVETFEEEDIHEWDNRLGTDHVVGQYQWIEKIYEAQVFNYGSRVLFDIVVPEPAAFIQYTMQSLPIAGHELKRPNAFFLDASQINVGNYATYAHTYNAEGVEAPPEAAITVTKVFEGVDDDADRGSVVKTAEVPIPDGYEAVHARAQISSTFWESNYRVAFSIGTRTWVQSGASTGWQQTVLDNQQRSITATMVTFRINVVAASVEVTCNRTSGALDRWRIRTHDAIKAGYLKQLKDYEDKLESAKAQASAQIQPRNPQLNAAVQREELKRAVIEVFTAQHFDAFNSVETGATGLPEINLVEAALEGPYIRFFEQAFEWQQMMYVYYPYFWGRKSRWVEMSLLQDADLEFAAFMKAGAARVVVSVRPGFELAVQHFLETGQIYEGGDPPTITSPTYLNIVDEIKERQNAPGAEIPVGNPWEVRVPTTLVLLRKKDSLPQWKKQPDGAWVDAT